MAITLSYSLRARDTLNKFQMGFDAPQVLIDQAEIGGNAGILNLDENEVAIPIGDVNTEGLLAMRNLDDSETIEFGPDAGTGLMFGMGLIPPGEIAHFRVKPGVTIMAAVFGSTHPAKLQFVLLED